MKNSQSIYLVAVDLDVPGAIHDQDTDSYVECYGATVLGQFTAESPEAAKQLSLRKLPQDAIRSAKENLHFHVFKLIAPGEAL